MMDIRMRMDDGSGLPWKYENVQYNVLHSSCSSLHELHYVDLSDELLFSYLYEHMSQKWEAT